MGRGMEGWEGEGRDGNGGRVRGKKGAEGGREGRESGGRARLGYLSRGPRVPSYAIGCTTSCIAI